MCDFTQGSLCPSPMGIHQCLWIQRSILQNAIYIRTMYRVDTVIPFFQKLEPKVIDP